MGFALPCTKGLHSIHRQRWIGASSQFKKLARWLGSLFTTHHHYDLVFLLLGWLVGWMDGVIRPPDAAGAPLCFCALVALLIHHSLFMRHRTAAINCAADWNVALITLLAIQLKMGGWFFFILAGRERALRGLSCGDEFSENDKELLVVVVRDKIMFALWLLFVRWRAEPWKGEFAKCVARLFLELRLRGVQRDWLDLRVYNFSF